MKGQVVGRGSLIMQSGWRVILFPEACGNGGQVEGQGSSISGISGSGRRVSFAYGGPRCVESGGGAGFCNLGLRVACPIIILEAC